MRDTFVSQGASPPMLPLFSQERGRLAQQPTSAQAEKLPIVVRGNPIFSTMSHAQNSHLVASTQIVNHQMGLVAMDTDSRRDFFAEACRMRIVCQKREGCAQAFMICIGLRKAELLNAIEEYRCKIVGCGTR